MNKEITYTIEYNSNTKTWCLFKNIKTSQGFNFYTILESQIKQECIDKLDEVKNGKDS